MEQRVQTICLVLIAIVLTGAALYWLRPMMVPFVMALFITMGLHAGAEFLEELKVPRSIAMPAAVLGGVGILVGMASLVSTSVVELTTKAELYNDHLSELATQATEIIPERWRPAQEAALSEIPVSTVGGFLVGSANAIRNVLQNSFVVLIFVLFLLVGSGGRRREATGIWGEAEKRIKRYIVTKAVISLATGFLVGLSLLMLGVPLALVFGMFAFLLNFIPSAGSFVATFLPLPILLVSPEVAPNVAVLAIVIPGAIQMTIGQFLEPAIMGESMDLHPVTILLSLTLWFMLWGTIGAILSVPITVVIKILCERFDGSRPLADLMAGRIDSFVSPGAADLL